MGSEMCIRDRTKRWWGWRWRPFKKLRENSTTRKGEGDERAKEGEIEHQGKRGREEQTELEERAFE